MAKEFASLAASYRDASAYPEPERTDLRQRLAAYTRFVIEKAWPAQRKGEAPQGSVQMMDEFQQSMASLETATKGQKIIHAEAFRQFNDMILLRRQRNQGVGTGIPGIMCYVVGVGAVVNTLIILCFRIRFDIHLILGGILAFFVGVLIFLITAMDHPFRGEVSVEPDAFQLVYHNLMAEKP